jgi:uncharacterized protein YceK
LRILAKRINSNRVTKEFQMKFSTLTLLALATTAIALTGCATTATSAGYKDNIDYAKTSAIENAAQRYGVKVYWLNYPQKRQTTTSAATPAGS